MPIVMCYNLAMSARNSSKIAEKELYKPIKEYLGRAFTTKFGACYLQITAEGKFSELLKHVVRQDIIFSFLGKKASPDLAGFIPRGDVELEFASSADVQDFITVEIKREKITLQDVYQAKMYGDLFQAKYALLISPEPIPEEVRRLDRSLFVTYRYMSGWYLYVGEWSSLVNVIEEERWLPKPPYKD